MLVAQLNKVLLRPRCYRPGERVPAYDSVVASFRAGTQIVQNQGDIRLLGGHAGNAAFMPRAPGHTVLLERRYFQTLVSPGGAPSSSVEQELTNWVGGQGRTLIH